MRTTLLAALTVVLAGWSSADEFIRALPTSREHATITNESHPGEDAVILLKEQRYLLGRQRIEVGRFYVTLPKVTETEILIVKALTEKAVGKFGSFEYSYTPFLNDDDYVTVEVRARVLKPNGRVETVDQDFVERIVAVESSEGDPIIHKIMLIIPNVAVGDVIQIEHSHARPSFHSSQIFFYNDEYPVLKSTVTVSLPGGTGAFFVSSPKEVVGEPIRSGEGQNLQTYTWIAETLQAIHPEPYAPPFRDQAAMTSFVLKLGEEVMGTVDDEWVRLISAIGSNLEFVGTVSDDRIRDLGFTPTPERPTKATVDSLYGVLRKTISILESNVDGSLSYSEIDDIFSNGRAFPSDLSFAMFKILKRWDLRPKFVLVSDKRAGSYGRSVPSLAWFDRLAVSLNLDGEDLIYDFDPSIPACNQFPWYLDGVEAIEFDELTFRHFTLRSPRPRKTIASEQHHLVLREESATVHETLLLFYRGSLAQERRSEWYGLDEEHLTESMERVVKRQCLRAVDSVVVNDFRCENDLTVSAYGTSVIDSRIIDTLLTVSLANHFLREFRDRIASKNRQNDLDLPEPFDLRMDWFMDLPDGYTVQGDLPNKAFAGPQRSRAAVMTALQDGKLLFRCRLSLGSSYFPRAQYGQFISFLDELLSETDRTLVFVRRDAVAASK